MPVRSGRPRLRMRKLLQPPGPQFVVRPLELVPIHVPQHPRRVVRRVTDPVARILPKRVLVPGSLDRSRRPILRPPKRAFPQKRVLPQAECLLDRVAAVEHRVPSRLLRDPRYKLVRLVDRRRRPCCPIRLEVQREQSRPGIDLSKKMTKLVLHGNARHEEVVSPPKHPHAPRPPLPVRILLVDHRLPLGCLVNNADHSIRRQLVKSVGGQRVMVGQVDYFIDHCKYPYMNINIPYLSYKRKSPLTSNIA